MKRLTWALLLLAVLTAVGCGSKDPGTPPPLDDGTRAEIAEEDAAIADLESQQ